MLDRDLQVGDILMKLYYGGAVHGLIAWGQRFHAAGNATDDYVHAAIYIGRGLIAESIGGGIRATRLMQQGKPYVYNVYRYGDANMAGIAGGVAEGWLAVRGGQHARDEVPAAFGGYAYAGAVGAAIQNIGSQPRYKPGEDLWGSGGKPGIGTTYCSQFVVAAYQAAGATGQPVQVPIRIAQHRATPNMLHDTLMSEPQWEMLGQITVK